MFLAWLQAMRKGFQVQRAILAGEGCNELPSGSPSCEATSRSGLECVANSRMRIERPVTQGRAHHWDWGAYSG